MAPGARQGSRGIVMSKENVTEGIMSFLGAIALGVIFFFWGPSILPEEVPLGLLYGLSAAFCISALFRFLWGLWHARSRARVWKRAFWSALWGIELAVLGYVAAFSFSAMRLVRFAYFLTGFYLQAKGATDISSNATPIRKSGLRDFLVGVAGMVIALIWET